MAILLQKLSEGGISWEGIVFILFLLILALAASNPARKHF